jgi:ribosome-dependent ATPase
VTGVVTGAGQAVAEPRTAAPAVALDGVSHRYGGRTALTQVSLAIPEGCLAGLIGPDGVGKSTLLALVAGVRRVQAGRVMALGGDMADPRHRRRCCPAIAYMPQGLGRNLYPTLSTYENLDFFGRLFGLPTLQRAARTSDLLDSVGLLAFRDRPAGKLSGGMKQKLALCCALIHDPDLLVLDEPTTGVDPLSRRQFWDLLDRIRAGRPRMTVLVATAYMEEAEGLDWLAAMDDGRVLATGTPAAIRRRARTDSLEAAFTALLPPAKRRQHERFHIAPRRAAGAAPAIVASGLTKRFGDFVAVDQVSFRIERGEIFGFLGSNGCGKSTTMKMLTGLLPASDGEASMLGLPVGRRNPELRRRVGYMSQSFSLYRELSVRQNLALHAQLFRLPPGSAEARIGELMQRYELAEVADSAPESLPLGIRQRLQLAVAVLHRPEILILDEPTSGVDPIARDRFWQSLAALSRDEGVTVFISTHFMSEAERCDRISLMHAGRVLAVGRPADLVAERGAASLEAAFIATLQEAAGPSPEPALRPQAAAPAATASAVARPRRFDLRRLWAYARREALEVRRDPVRLAFAVLGPMILMLTFGYGISFDVENLRYAVLDQDRSLESRELVSSFEGSRYFQRAPDLAAPADVAPRLRTGRLALALEIPPGFGRDLEAGRQPEVAAWIDGAMPFRAETVRGYVSGLAQSYLEDRAARQGAGAAATGLTVEPRFLYNQQFKSVFAMVPGIVMLMLVLVPAMMTAVGVVREKETGSIANFRATPVSRLEFLLGKQAPYLAIAFFSLLTLVGLALVPFGVPVRGSVAALISGGALYVGATTAFGLVASAFTRTQVAAIFATAIVCLVPAVNFSGLLTPVSSLSPGGRLSGLAFPSAWFQQISVGTFTKGLGFAELWPNHLALAGFTVLFIGAAVLALRKQEP